MSDPTQSTSSPETGAPPAIAVPTDLTGPATSPAAAPVTPDGEAEAEAIYDSEVAILMGTEPPQPPPTGEGTPPISPASPTQVTAPAPVAPPAPMPAPVTPGQLAAGGATGEAQPPETAPGSPPGSPPVFSDAQIQLMSRMHIQPIQITQWPAEQQTAFLDNAAKRESDQTTAYKAAKDELQQLKGQVDSGNDNGKGEQGKAGGATGDQVTPIAELQAAAKQDVAELADVYGPEMQHLDAANDKMFQAVGQVQTELGQFRETLAEARQLVAEMTIDNGIRSLAGDFPSLSKPEVRAQVEAQFFAQWNQPNNPHRTGDATLPVKVRNALGDAAKAILGNNTENAAQVNLLNKTKERLGQQPSVGSGRGKAEPLTEEDVYAQEYAKHLKDK